MVIFCSLPVALSWARDVQDAVGVDVEGDLDLRHAARRGQDAVEHEAPERPVVGGHGALALEDVDLHAGLVVRRGAEDLALAGGDGGVARDERRSHAAQGLDAEGQRRDVEQEDVLDLALEHAGLDGRADGDHLVRVDALVRLLAEELRTFSCTSGMRVWPPTRMTSSIWAAVMPASVSAWLAGAERASPPGPRRAAPAWRG